MIKTKKMFYVLQKAMEISSANGANKNMFDL